MLHGTGMVVTVHTKDVEVRLWISNRPDGTWEREWRELIRRPVLQDHRPNIA
jgi:hypothetical protein